MRKKRRRLKLSSRRRKNLPSPRRDLEKEHKKMSQLTHRLCLRNLARARNQPGKKKVAQCLHIARESVFNTRAATVEKLLVNLEVKGRQA